MRVVLADLKSHRGFVSKDTVVGGYGSRLDPFTRVTTVMAYLKKKFHDVPSVHMAYIAAILARAGHEVKWTRGEEVQGDVALVLSSLVDHKNETAWADRMRAKGVKVGFIGITASKMPDLFKDHCDFILNGEPEAAVMRLAQGIVPEGIVVSEQIDDLDSLPFPQLGSRDRGSLADVVQGVHPSGRRRLSASGQPGLPGVLHLLPAPHPRRLPHAIHREYRRRDGTAVRPRVAAVRHLPRSALHRTARARRRIVRRDQAARIESHVRGGDEARSARCRPAGQALQRRVPRDELRRRIARSGDAQEVRPASHSAEPPARDHRALPETGHRDGGLLRARIPPGRLELRRGDDRLRHRSGIHVRAVQDADAVSRHADVQTDRAAAQRNRLGAVRRLHAGVQASEPDQRAS